ncbi:pyruvate formate lyase family protein, partial [Staphylococcus epidermidis]|uniref:pyruvate formate lyase family protein n=1 Tax=Staphylococcus epidermidis TaxID=1282 RepID=UPI0037D9DC3B
MKYPQLKPIPNHKPLLTHFQIQPDFPKYPNNHSPVHQIPVHLLQPFITKLPTHKTYPNSQHTITLLTITSNLLYPNKTPNTPDPPKARQPFPPRPNPIHPPH